MPLLRGQLVSNLSTLKRKSASLLRSSKKHKGIIQLLKKVNSLLRPNKRRVKRKSKRDKRQRWSTDQSRIRSSSNRSLLKKSRKLLLKNRRSLIQTTLSKPQYLKFHSRQWIPTWQTTLISRSWWAPCNSHLLSLRKAMDSNLVLSVHHQRHRIWWVWGQPHSCLHLVLRRKKATSLLLREMTSLIKSECTNWGPLSWKNLSEQCRIYSKLIMKCRLLAITRVKARRGRD